MPEPTGWAGPGRWRRTAYSPAQSTNSAAANSPTAPSPALTLSAADGPLPIGDIIGSVVLAGTAVYDLTSRVYLTYILHHPDGRVYVGRTSGFGSPFQVMMKRYYGHERRKEGFRNPELDRFAHGAVGGRAIRGREQQLIDYFGGIGNPKVANTIRGVGFYNLNGWGYHIMSNLYFGNIAGYSGFFKIQ